MNSVSFVFYTSSLFFFLLFPARVLSQACQKSCGSIPILYPFGTGPGCGDPRFHNFVTCTYNDDQSRQEELVLKTHSGALPIHAIDYTNQVIHISDPSMSTCACMQPSKGFGLDWDAPFSLVDNTVFALLGCSVTSSPVFSNSFNANFTESNAPLCDASGAPICSQLYACPAVAGLNLPLYSPASSCCVYSPVDLGPSFDMDVEKLQCTSYTSVDNFNYQQLDATKWKYSISLKYKFSVNNVYTLACMQCEKSDGVCGYTGIYNTFVCNCPAGFNTSMDCLFGEAYWGHGFRILPQIWTGIMLLLLGTVIMMD